jgi:hypothetical protein
MSTTVMLSSDRSSSSFLNEAARAFFVVWDKCALREALVDRLHDFSVLGNGGRRDSASTMQAAAALGSLSAGPYPRFPRIRRIAIALTRPYGTVK